MSEGKTLLDDGLAIIDRGHTEQALSKAVDKLVIRFKSRKSLEDQLERWRNTLFKMQSGNTEMLEFKVAASEKALAPECAAKWKSSVTILQEKVREVIKNRRLGSFSAFVEILISFLSVTKA